MSSSITQGLWEHLSQSKYVGHFKLLYLWMLSSVHLDFSSSPLLPSLPCCWPVKYLPLKTQAAIISSRMGLLEANSPLPNWQKLFTTSLRTLSEDAARSLACVSIAQLSLLTLVPRSLPLSQQTLPTSLWISENLSACSWRGFNPGVCYRRLTGRLCGLAKSSTFQGQKTTQAYTVHLTAG